MTKTLRPGVFVGNIAKSVAFILCCTGLLLALAVPGARAQGGIPTFVVRQYDLNGDGRPDMTAVDCAFASSYDRILIFDRAGDMGTGTDVRAVADFKDDVWIFDVGADQTAQLVLMFAQEGGRRAAYIYDDRDGDGAVSYRARPGYVEVTESPWHVRVVADPDWFLPDGRVNPRLLFQIDGYVLRYLEWGEAAPAPEWARRATVTDGTVDWEIEVADVNGDGIADYQLQRLRRSSPEDANIFRATLYVNRRPRPHNSYPDALFWPLLVGKHNSEDYNYFDYHPVLSVDWAQAKIYQVGILGYPTEQGYHINSRAPWKKGEVNYANFENPIAYYDLAEDADGRPELVVRLEVFAERDPSFSDEAWLLRGFPRPIVQADYPWDQNNDGRWDYQLSLAGFHPVTPVVEFPDFAVRTVPYGALPDWVMEREWAVATFVVAETAAYWGSEGMLEWEVNRGFRDGQLVEPSGLRNLYMTGLIDEPPLENYAEIRRGMRGEYATDGVGRPTLYWSPVDRRLHLFRAQGGLWNVDGQATVRYADRDGDGYLDEWLYTSDGTIRQLNVGRGFLLYAGDGEVLLRKADVSPAALTVSPPRNRAEWERLRQILDARPSPLPADDVKGMATQFEGPEVRIEGATVRDVRVTRRGIRFVLEVRPGGRVASDAWALFPAGLTPGAYVVANEADRWSVRPLTPAAPVLVSVEGPAAREGEWATLAATVLNAGLEDIRSLPLCAILDGPGGTRQVLTATVPFLPGEGQREVWWDWRPPRAGGWSLTVVADCEGIRGAPTLLGQARLQVAHQSPLYLHHLLALPARVRGAVVALLVSAVALAGGMMALWLRQKAVPPEADYPARWHLFLLTVYVLLAAGYVGARFLWNWTSTDDARLTVAAERVYAEGTILPSADAYPFGYAYPTLNAFLAHWTGLSIPALQTFVQPFLVVMLVPLAFAAYHQLTGQVSVGLLAATLLFLQPEFLFESVRSSHPKMTWALALGLLYALAVSFRTAGEGRPIGRWVALCYLFAFGLTTSSAFFASSYLFAIACAFAGWRALRARNHSQSQRWLPLMRLLYVTISFSILLYICIYHIYPPARGQLSLLRTIVDQVALLFLSVDVATNPYGYIQRAWISEGIYIALTLFNWVVLALSAGFWLSRARRVWEGRGELSPNQVFVWLLYGGFGLFLAISVVLDLAGALSANLQVRVFPHLMIVAIPLAAEALGAIAQRARQWSPPGRRLLAAVGVLAVAGFSLASLLKVTNEPFLSYNWLFYADQERMAVDWLGNYSADAPVWTGLDERLVALTEAADTWKVRRLKARRGEPDPADPAYPYLILSETITLRAWRTGELLPDIQPYNRVYDNRFTAIYRLQPTSPYRR